MATLARLAANYRAIAFPNPRDEPVTNAVLPFNDILHLLIVSLFCFHLDIVFLFASETLLL